MCLYRVSPESQVLVKNIGGKGRSSMKDRKRMELLDEFTNKKEQ